jgi:formimidoylglutamate deiminase
MTTLFARKALLPSGWSDDVRFDVADGRIERVQAGMRPERYETVFDCVIPGIGNSHSHAFQRALAGWTEERSPSGRDSFWTWRERMYELATAMNPERLEAIARQAYTEMLASGYTSVAEFHYLHATGDGPDAMFEALRAAAAASGIRFTYVPVLYERAGFAQATPEGAQRLFASDVESFLAHFARVRGAAGGRVHIGIGAHSIRAVTPASLERIAGEAAAADVPMHIHIAEQRREVEQSLEFYQLRPVRWLLERCEVDARWCLVHATHMDETEITDLAATGAVVSLCPSTEANLGDGLFPLRPYLEANGRIAIGSDSQVSINPYEELRWLEYGQRLAAQSRNIAAVRDSHVGRELFELCVDGGAQACGHAVSGLAAGAYADLVCLHDGDPMLVGHTDASRIDALVFSGYSLPIDRVMVHGEWCVVDGRHVSADGSREDYARAVAGLVPEGVAQ